MQEGAAEDLGDREDPMPVRPGPEHMTAEPPAELHGPFLRTAWAGFSFFTRKREDPFLAAGIAADAGKTVVQSRGPWRSYRPDSGPGGKPTPR